MRHTTCKIYRLQERVKKLTKHSDYEQVTALKSKIFEYAAQKPISGNPHASDVQHQISKEANSLKRKTDSHEKHTAYLEKQIKRLETKSSIFFRIT